MTAPARFRQSDVTRFLKGAAKAGVDLTRVELCPKTGRLIGFTGTPDKSMAPGEVNEWDVALQM